MTSPALAPGDDAEAWPPPARCHETPRTTALPATRTLLEGVQQKPSQQLLLKERDPTRGAAGPCWPPRGTEAGGCLVSRRGERCWTALGPGGSYRVGWRPQCQQERPLTNSPRLQQRQARLEDMVLQGHGGVLREPQNSLELPEGRWVQVSSCEWKRRGWASAGNWDPLLLHNRPVPSLAPH